MSRAVSALKTRYGTEYQFGSFANILCMYYSVDFFGWLKANNKTAGIVHLITARFEMIHSLLFFRFCSRNSSGLLLWEIRNSAFLCCRTTRHGLKLILVAS